MMESKKAIYDLIPPAYYPKTILVKANSPFETVRQHVSGMELVYPMIAKPDIGLRGSAVKKVNSDEELQQYNSKAKFDYIVQDLIPFPNEVGIFYVRYPDAPSGKITGIVAKEFLIVIGDGRKTVEELLLENPRYAFQLSSLQKEYGHQLHDVLPKGQQLNLVPYGNHARGAKFIDATKWNNPELERTIDIVCKQIDGFYFGRIDIMYNTIDELA
ncbi:MAG TPA: D-alanine--D-alanine ligase, partial [Flavobacterium sp.]|nr:D-alanine--D-alanine ligase [Flavobacterium sp.]